MKKLLGVCAILALISGGVVLSDEVMSLVDQNTDSGAAQAVESAVDDSVAQPMQEALPEQEAVPEQEALPQQEVIPEQEALPEQVETPEPSLAEEAVENALPESNKQYILGVIASPVPPMVRAQINLPENVGLFIQTIKSNGPAVVAGVLPYDIIVSIDGVAVSNTNELAALVQKAAGKPQKLTVLRHGKELTLDITAQPVDIPTQSHSLLFGTPVPPDQQPFFDPKSPDYDLFEDDDCTDPTYPRIQQFMERQRRQMEIMRQRMEAMENAMRQGLPGFMPFPGLAPLPAPSPTPTPAPAPGAAPSGPQVLPSPQFNNPNGQIQSESFSVQVQKNGNEPAIIRIQENGNEYIVDENSIDQLPENIRNRLNFNIQTNEQ